MLLEMSRRCFLKLARIFIWLRSQAIYPQSQTNSIYKVPNRERAIYSAQNEGVKPFDANCWTIPHGCDALIAYHVY